MTASYTMVQPIYSISPTIYHTGPRSISITVFILSFIVYSIILSIQEGYNVHQFSIYKEKCYALHLSLNSTVLLWEVLPLYKIYFKKHISWTNNLTGSISKYTISPPVRAMITCRWFKAHLTIVFLPGAFHSLTRRSARMWRMPSG